MRFKKYGTGKNRIKAIIFIILAIIIFATTITVTVNKNILKDSNKVNLSEKVISNENSSGDIVEPSNSDTEASPSSLSEETEIQTVAAEDPNWNKTSARICLTYDLKGTFGGVARKNQMHVFAFEGDTICLGTNIYNSSISLDGTTTTNNDHVDKDSYDIVMYGLDGKATGIDINENGKGHIKDYDTEQLAKQMTSPKGNGDYVPYTIHITETGIYSFEFRSYSGSGTTNETKHNNKTNGWSNDIPSTSGSLICAWDITVFNENGEKKTGRTYTDYLALQTTGNIKEDYYILTTDSYIYKMHFASVQAYTFTFFANNRGITDIANGNIVYKSVKDFKNDVNFLKFGVDYTKPSTDDTDIAKNFHIFLEEPNADLKGYLYDNAILPDPAENVKFSSDDTYEGSGGYFSFDVKEATTATLRIDFKIGEDEDEYAPVEISDVVTPYSTNYFYWDGKDGNGKTIPANTYNQDKITYSVTTKAGEIHFPLIDIETATEGITFTRINHIYDKSGNQLDTDNSIYDATKNIIYYDDTAIYYGEKVTNTGAEEKNITYSVSKTLANSSKVTEDTPVPLIKDNEGKEIYAFQNILSPKCSENITYNEYGADNGLRVGDHSSFNNSINYNSTVEAQKNLINYLDSKEHPVAQSGINSYVTHSNSGKLNVDDGFTGKNYNTTTDYGIANFWTFVSSSPVTSDTEINIQGNSDNRFNLTARVFYDEQPGNGLYDKENDGDHLLENVTLNLYKEIGKNPVLEPNKTYVYLKDGKYLEKVTDQASDIGGQTIYELIKTGVTPLSGAYVFTGLEYNETDGTNFLYQVIKPNSSFQITSSNKKGQDGIKSSKSTTTTYDNNGTKKTETNTYYYGHYTLYKYNTESTGTEIQTFKVGGDGITFNDEDSIGNNVTTIDVGYKYNRNTAELDIKKIWKNTDDNIETPDSVVLEVCYNTLNGEKIYKEQPLSAIQFWNHSYKYLETEIDGIKIKDWYVSAEYYIYGDKIFRHQYAYTADENIYGSLVGNNSYVSFTNLEVPKSKNEKEYTFEDIPDFNGDNVNDWNDLSQIPENKWNTALPAGSTENEKAVVAPFKSVLDRNIGTAATEINITNSTNPGTIEILKYTGSVADKRYLSGATFRLYKGDITTVKGAIDHYNTVLENSKTNSSTEEEVQAALQKVQDLQVDSATTRINGRLVFSGLNPNETYTVRERFAPSGYRILNEYYEVNPYSTKTKSSDETEEISEDNKKEFDQDNYCLLYIGNAEASGSLGIQKTLVGRAWTDEDEFTFDISIEKANVKPNYSGLEDTDSFEEQIDQFCQKFSDNSKEVTINNENDYATIKEDQIDPNTKIAPNLLKSGIPDTEIKSIFENASLDGKQFPVAGTYTFTIKENDDTKDDTIKYSKRVFTVIIDVNRVLNDSEKPDGDTHLEASISKISYVDSDDEDNKEKSITYAGNTPTFINTYIVKEVDQKVSYIVQKNLIGRKDNQWENTDKFEFSITGFDEPTQTALQKENLVIEGDELENYNGGKKFTIDSDTSDHQYVFTNIDFKNIEFPVENKENETPVTKPVEYKLLIQEIIPTEPTETEKKGSYIKYSSDQYMLQIILENGNNNIFELHNSETDGVIGTITFKLYKNYNPNANATNNPMSVCQITREKNADGSITEKETHGQQHTMTFDNTCETTFKVTKIWSGDDGHEDKRPESIKVSLKGKSNKDTILERDAIISDSTGWSHTFEDVREYDSLGEKIIYSIEEIPVHEKDLVLYANPIKKINDPTDDDGYVATIENNFKIPTDTIDIPISKIWNDDNNSAEKRPDNVTLTFKDSHGDTAYTVNLDESDKDDTYNVPGQEKWSETLTLRVYDDNGDEVIYDDYVLSEDFNSILYNAEIDNENRTITNTFKVPEDKIEIDVEKIWSDTDDYYGKRPKNLSIILYGDGNKVSEQTIDASSNWKYTFTNLDKYNEKGDLIVYTAEEKAIETDDLFFYKGEAGAIQKDNSVTDSEKYTIQITNTLDKIPAKLRINYLDKYDPDHKLSKEVVIEGIVGNTFDISKYDIQIDGYTLLQKPTSLTGEYTNELQDFVFYYAKNSKVTANYLEKDTRQVLHDPQEISGYEGLTYSTKKEDIDNYTFVEVEGEPEGTMKKDNIVVNYWYAQNTKVIVQHIDKNSNKVLKEDTFDGIVGQTILTQSTDIEGYVLVSSPSSQSVTMEKDVITIKYYYVHVSEGVLEKHIDYITNDVLDSELHSGNEGDSYDIPSKEFTGYDLLTEDKDGNSLMPDNSSGTMKKELVEVKYYYAKKATLKVQYINKETGAKLTQDIITEGHEGDDYTAEEKTFKGYTLVETVGSPKGTLSVTIDEDENFQNETVVIFLYERSSAKVIEKHIDITTKDVLEEIEHDGKIGDPYEISSKEFTGYDLVEVDSNGKSKLPTNNKGKMTEEDIVVSYYYIRKAEIEINYLEDGTNMPLLPPEIRNGHVGDKYSTERKDFDYYVFVKDTENTEGKMTKDKITINYYYRKQTFNLKVIKWIDNISVDGTKYKGKTIDTHDDLSQISIHTDNLGKSIVKITYNIRIINDSELEGTINELSEIIPKGFSFYQEDNLFKWDGKDNIYRTTDLKDIIVKPGEHYDLLLTLRWNNEDGNFGKKVSKTVISSVNNIAGFEEVTLDDNSSEAPILISLATGINEIHFVNIYTVIISIFLYIVLSTKKNTKKFKGKHSNE